MTSPPPLYNITAAQRHYATKRVSDPNEPYCTCWRNFGEKEDPSNLSELACRPLQLQPCHHIVGDQCFKEMRRHAMATCPMCRAPLTILQDRTSSFQKWIAESLHVRACIDVAVECIRDSTQATNFDTLSQRLFAEDLRLADAMELWWLYMCAWLDVSLRKGSRWLMESCPVVYMLNDVVRWVSGHSSLECENAFDLSLILLEGHAVMGVVVTMLFGICAGLLILAGTELPSFGSFRGGQRTKASTYAADNF
jgi:hypothetical protein